MDKFIENIIKELVPQLPVVMEYSTEEHIVDGSELIAQGHMEHEDGRMVHPGMKYKQNMPVMMAINHKRRIKESYKKQGKQGILSYIDEINKLAKKQNHGKEKEN